MPWLRSFALLILFTVPLGEAIVHSQSRCGTDHYAVTNPQATIGDNNKPFAGSRSSGEISVVFHVFTLQGKVELPTFRILDQIDILNKDYNGGSISIMNIPEDIRRFVDIASISFCLASEDPMGKATEGIIHYETSNTGLASRRGPNGRRAIKHADLGGADAWDTEKYLNIWIMQRDDFIGDATFPEAAGTDEDGIVISPDVIGAYNKLNERFDRGKTLSHEIGHYLGLYHIWGSETNCEVDDFLQDTPKQEGPYFGCPEYPQHSCGSMDFIYNFMDFSDDQCLRYFTKNQVTVMQRTLNSERASLLDNACTIGQEESNLDNVLVYHRRPTILVRSSDDLPLDLDISLFDIMGRRIADGRIRNGHVHQMDVSLLPFGIYIVLLENDSGKSARKILVSKNR